MAGQLVTKSSCGSGQQCESSIHDDNPQCIVTVARETGTEISANLQCTTTCFKNSESSNAVQVILGWLCQNLSSCLNILVLIEDTLLVEGNLLIFTKVYQCVELNLFCFLTHKHCMILPCNIQCKSLSALIQEMAGHHAGQVINWNNASFWYSRIQRKHKSIIIAI